MSQDIVDRLDGLTLAVDAIYDKLESIATALGDIAAAQEEALYRDTADSLVRGDPPWTRPSKREGGLNVGRAARRR